MVKHKCEHFDLIIIGAGCVGMAAAYYASQNYSQKKIILIDQSSVINEDPQRYWSSSFSARQNRVQYTQKYLTEFVLESNQEWEALQKIRKQKQIKTPLKHNQGALWFGDKTIKTSEGNILESNVVINDINNSNLQSASSSNSNLNQFKRTLFRTHLTEHQKHDLKYQSSKTSRIEKLYLQSIYEKEPKFFEAFKKRDSNSKEWDSWSALYQPDGGSINMKETYNFLLAQIKDKVEIRDNTTVVRYQRDDQIRQSGLLPNHKFYLQNCKQQKTTIAGSHVLIAAGIWTPYFLKEIIKEGEHLKQQALIQQYVASYFKIKPEKQQFMKTWTTFYNFIEENESQNQYSAYGFPFHDWDTQQGANYAKLGTLAHRKIQYDEFLKNKWSSNVQKTDRRVLAAKKYISQRMTVFDQNDNTDKHFACPIIFYNGRQTILDYLNRKRKTIVVQTGGWVGKYFPLLAKTAVEMLFDKKKIKSEFNNNESRIGKFLHRTRFPIRRNVQNYLRNQPKLYSNEEGQIQYDVVTVGAGCSGLYANYRLHKEINRKSANHQNGKALKLGIFQKSDRISGRLYTVQFTGTTTPMELGGMRYIAKNHELLNKVIEELGIPSLEFQMNGDPIQQYALTAYFRDDTHSQNQWQHRQNAKQRLLTAYRIRGNIVGMTAFQMISYSLYLIASSPYNKELINQKLSYSQKRDKRIRRDFEDCFFQNPNNKLDYTCKLYLEDWNNIKPYLLIRYPYQLQDQKDNSQKKKTQFKPLYKFGFQNIIEAQFGHQAYNFISEQNGYFSNTSNASYLQQVVTYLLDFGDVKYRTLSGGFDMVNYNLANQLLDPYTGIRNQHSPNSYIFLNHQLINIIKENKNGQNRYSLTFKCPNGKVTVKANKVILAMPKRSVQILANKIQLLQQPLTNFQSNQPPQIIKYKTGESLPQQHEQDKKDFITLNANNFPRKENDEDYIELDAKIWQNDKAKTPSTIFQLISSTQNMPAVKIIMNFDRNWWDPNLKLNNLYKQDHPNAVLVNSINQMRGVSATDLPIRQTLYFSTATDYMLLASYNDMITVQYWETLHNNFSQLWSHQKLIQQKKERQYKQKNQQKIQCCLAPLSVNEEINKQKVLKTNYSKENQNFIGDKANPNIYQAKTVMVDEVIRQLQLLHGVQIDRTWVKECWYQNWGSDPFGGGYHNWYSGYDIEAVMKCIRKPWKDENIHIVGEAFSNLTGWVEGALQTTDHLLHDEFNLPFAVEGYHGW